MSSPARVAPLVLALVCATPGAPAAQSRPSVEVQAGGAGFVDDATIHHRVLGGAARFPLSPRLTVGPEVIYFVGPGSDRDLTVTGNVWFDVTRAQRVTPFLVGGAGLFRHSQRLAGGTFSSGEGAFTGGGGVRVDLGRGWYVAPEVRVGWELHLRTSVAFGRRF